MSDFRNDDPFRRDSMYVPNAGAGSSAWSSFAAAAFIVGVLAIVFVFGHRANQGANNQVATNAPAVTHMSPPAGFPPKPSIPPASPAPTTTHP